MQPFAGEVALNGALAGTTLAVLLGDDGRNLRRGAPGCLASQRLSQFEEFRGRARLGCARWRHQRLEAAAAPGPDPTVERAPRHSDAISVRGDVIA